MKLIAIVPFLIAIPVSARADLVRMDFSFESFFDFSASTPAPTDPVAGTIWFNADDVHSPAGSIVDISLVIDGLEYIPSEVGAVNYSDGFSVIGAIANGTDGLLGGSKDFRIRWNRNTLLPDRFQYTTPGLGNIWHSITATEFSISQSSGIPEPASLPLLVAFIAAGGVLRRRSCRVPR